MLPDFQAHASSALSAKYAGKDVGQIISRWLAKSLRMARDASAFEEYDYAEMHDRRA